MYKAEDGYLGDDGADIFLMFADASVRLGFPVVRCPGLPFPAAPAAARQSDGYGRSCRQGHTSLFYAELGANLCEQAFQFVHFSFETRDVGLHRREFRDAERRRLSR